MKKIAMLILTTVLSFGLLAGCSNSESGNNSSDQISTASAETGDSGKILMNSVVKDLELNDVAIADYVKGNKVTMINIWGTFCGPCIKEMPDLGEIERKYKDQGFEIIGLTSDIADPEENYDENTIDDAKAIIKDTGITYPVLASPVQLMEDLKIQYVPTTFFLDSEGNVLGTPEIGSKSSADWEDIITSYLSAQD